MEVNSPLQQAWFHLSGLEREIQDLRQRLSELTALINRSPVVIFRWRLEPGWPVVFVSENVRQFGYTPFDFTSGRVTWSGITHPDDAARLEDEMAANAARGVRNFTKEYRIFTKAGDIRAIEDYTAAILNENGDLTHYEGVLIDVTERKLAEEALRESEHKFALLFQSSPVPMSMSSLVDQRFIDVNEAFERINGYTRAEVVGHTAVSLNLLNTTERERIVELITSGDKHATSEMPYHTRSGETRIGLFSGRIIEFKGEQTVLMVSQDITAQKQAEDALRSSEHKFATLFHLAPLPIGIVDVETAEIVDINQSYERILGYRKAEVVGRKVADLGITDPESRGKMLALANEQGYFDGVQGHFRTKSGAQRTALFTGQVLELGDRRLLLTAAIDITDRSRAEEAMHRALDDHLTRMDSHYQATDTARGLLETRYQALVENLAVPVCRWLPDTTLTYVNPACCRMLGKSRGELLGRSWLNFLPEEAQESLRDQSAKFIRRPREATLLRTFLAADGTPRTMRWVDTPISNANGMLAEIQSVGQDVIPFSPEGESTG